MIALLFVISAAFPADDLSGPAFRLYNGHASACLDAYEADPSLRAAGGPMDRVGLSVMAYTDNGDDVCATVERADAMGVQAHPATRVYLTFPREVLITKSHWDDMAQQLFALTLCREAAGNRVALDVEDYGPTAHLTRDYLGATGTTVEELRERMKNFLDLVATFEHVGVYPASPNDEAHRAIIDAAGEAAEIWDESTFGGVADALEGNSEALGYSYAKAITRYARHWPGVPVRAGLFGAYLRNDGHRARQAQPDLQGALHPWFFDRYRADTYPPNIANTCTRSWQQNLLYDSRNDIAQAWLMSLPMGDAELVRAEDSYQRQLRQYARGLDNSDMPTDDRGFSAVRDGRRLEAVIPLSGERSYTIGATLRIDAQGPAGPKVLIGRVRSTGSGNQNQWSITATDDGAGYLLELRGRNGKGPQPLGVVGLGQPCRVTITWHRPTSTVQARVATMAGEIGAASVKTRPEFDTYTLLAIQPDREGTVSVGDQVVVALRAWTPEEMSREAPGTLWPWGRQ